MEKDSPKDNQIIHCNMIGTHKTRLGNDSQMNSHSKKEIEIKLQQCNSIDEHDPSNFFRMYNTALSFDYDWKLEEHQKMICHEVLESWKNKDISLTKAKNFSSGGSGTYLITCPGANPEQVIVHARYVTPLDPFIDQRMHDCHMELWKQGLAVPRIVSGSKWDWYIETYFEDKTKDYDTKCYNKNMARFLALIHKTPVEWFDPWREKFKEKCSYLKEVNDGNHIWSMACRFEQFQNTGDEESKKSYIKFGLTPLSEYARRIVTVHADYHGPNILITKEGKFVCLDFERTHVNYAINDFAGVFNQGSYGTKTAEGQWEFVKNYLNETLGRNVNDEEIELFLFDVQCSRTIYRFGKEALRDFKITTEDKSYNFKLYKEIEAFEKYAREDLSLKKKIALKGFKEIFSIAYVHCNRQDYYESICDEIFKTLYKLQLKQRRKAISIEDDNKNHFKAFEDHNIIIIKTSMPLMYNEAKKLAEEKALGLPTRIQLIKSGLKVQDGGPRHQMFVAREDGQSDVCNLTQEEKGTYSERYASNVDKVDNTKNEKKWFDEDPKDLDFITLFPCERPMYWFYAIKDNSKNSEFVKFDEDFEKEILGGN